MDAKELENELTRRRLRGEEVEEAPVRLDEPLDRKAGTSGVPLELMPKEVQRDPGVLPPKLGGDR